MQIAQKKRKEEAILCRSILASVTYRERVEEVHGLGASRKAAGSRRTEAVGINNAPPQRPRLGVVWNLGVVLRFFPQVARKGVGALGNHLVKVCRGPFRQMRGGQILHQRRAHRGRERSGARHPFRVAVHACFRVGYAHLRHALRCAHGVLHVLRGGLGPRIAHATGGVGGKVLNRLAEHRMRRPQAVVTGIFKSIFSLFLHPKRSNNREIRGWKVSGV